jgi:hypothetical protein
MGGLETFVSNPQQFGEYPGGHGQAQQGYAPPAPRNGLGTAALVLGIVGIALSWIPFIGFIGFICALVGLSLGIGGIVRANKGGASNRTTAIIGTLLSVIAVIISITVWSAAASAISKAVGPATVTPGSAPAAPGQAPAPAQTSFAAGQTADIEGLQVTASPLRKAKPQFGSPVVCSDVSYQNNSQDKRSYNGGFDWKLQDPNGAIVSTTMGGDDKMLSAGELAPGGKVTGSACFTDPKLTGDFKIIYNPMDLHSTQVEWAAKL